MGLVNICFDLRLSPNSDPSQRKLSLRLSFIGTVCEARSCAGQQHILLKVTLFVQYRSEAVTAWPPILECPSV
jgi:hypothetical protein